MNIVAFKFGNTSFCCCAFFVRYNTPYVFAINIKLSHF